MFALSMCDMHKFGQSPDQIDQRIPDILPEHMRAAWDPNRNISPVIQLFTTKEDALVHLQEWLAESQILEDEHKFYVHDHPSGRTSYVAQDADGKTLMVASLTYQTI